MFGGDQIFLPWCIDGAYRTSRARVPAARDGGEMDLKMERMTVTLVIKRLYSKDRVLHEIHKPDAGAGERAGDRLLVVHPQHEL